MSSNQMEEEQLQVGKIIAKRVEPNGSVYYRVLWKNQPISNATWQPLLFIQNAKSKIQQYQKKAVNQQHNFNNKIQKSKKIITDCHDLNKITIKNDKIQIKGFQNAKDEKDKDKQNDTIINNRQQPLSLDLTQNKNSLQVYQVLIQKNQDNNISIKSSSERVVIIIDDDSDPDNYDEGLLNTMLIKKRIGKKIFKKRNKQGIRIKYTIDIVRLLKDETEVQKQTQFQQSITNQKIKQSPLQSQDNNNAELIPQK